MLLRGHKIPRETNTPGKAIIRTMSSSVDQFLTQLQLEEGAPAIAPAVFAETIERWKYATDEEVYLLLSSILKRLPSLPDDDKLNLPLLEALFQGLAQRYTPGSSDAEAPTALLAESTLTSLAPLYDTLGPRNSSRYQILRVLASAGNSTALELFAQRLVDDPPTEPRQLDAACVPLFQATHLDVDALFPKLFDSLGQPILAAIVLDLANHLYRRGMVDVHPAASRAESLARLLKAMAERLRLVEEQPGKYAADQQELQKLIGESASLIISLCDALGAIGDDAAVPALNTVLEVRHRRLRAEAATALARLGEKRGTEMLVELAADPASRIRALAYLEELDRLEAVPQEHRSPAAGAEGQLSSWLAEPQQIGLAPQSIEVVDQRRQFWPGFDEPQDCFLIRYEYPFPKATLIGIGLVGPTTYCLAVDLQDLSPADIYAIYAGWHADHPELFEEDVTELADSERDVYEMAGKEIDAENVELALVGRFFGLNLPVYRARRANQPGFFVVDGDKMAWYGAGNNSRPLGAREAYWIHKGRRLLATFNAENGEDDEPQIE